MINRVSTSDRWSGAAQQYATAAQRALTKSLSAVLACLLCACATTPTVEEQSKAKTGLIVAQELRQNTVKVTTDKDDGFGFIVGEKDGLIYIVTANHVVRGKNEFPGDSPSPDSIKVEFYEDRGARKSATLLETSIYDIAILQVTRPPNISWRKKALASTDVKEADKIWFIGREGEWYVPYIPGSINRVDSKQRITIDNVSVQEGTSGAPLVSSFGIVGMVTSDGKDLVSYALPIEVIEDAVKSWRRPWELTEFDDRNEVIEKAGLEAAEEEEGSKTWMWVLVGIAGALLALGSDSGGTSDDATTGTISVSAPTP